MAQQQQFMIDAMANPPMPALTVGPHRVVKMAEKTLNFVKVTDAIGSDILFTSPVFSSSNKVPNECIGYPVLLVEDELNRDHLKGNVQWIEWTASQKLHEFVKKPDCGVSKPLRELYCAKPELRPSFRHGADIYWAKYAKNCLGFNWAGEPMKLKDMGPGRFQLVLRLNGIFMGQHGDTDYVASLNLRVIQVRHEPSVIEGGGNIPQTCLMSDYHSVNTIDDLWTILNTTPAAPPSSPVCPPAPTKKPKLKRQDAIVLDKPRSKGAATNKKSTTQN